MPRADSTTAGLTESRPVTVLRECVTAKLREGKGFGKPLLHTVRGAGYMIRDGAD